MSANVNQVKRQKIWFRQVKHRLLTTSIVVALNGSSLAFASTFSYRPESFLVPWVHQQMGQEPFLVDQTAQSLAREQAFRSENEWNQLVSEDFRRIVENQPANTEDPEFAVQGGQLDAVGRKLNELLFGTLQSHLASLNADLNPQSDVPNRFLANSKGTNSIITNSINDSIRTGQASPITVTVPGPIEAHSNPNRQSIFVEAFHRSEDPLLGVDIEPISTERFGSEEGSRGWSLALSAGHKPTLFWQDEGRKEHAKTPLMHQNTIETFKNPLLGAIVQSAGAGIIYGKLAAGWQVELAPNDQYGKAESIFLNSQGIPQADSGQERYFVLFNVKPGSRVIYLKYEGTNSYSANPNRGGLDSR